MSEKETREPAELKKRLPQKTAKSTEKLRQAADHGLTADSHPGSGHQQRRLQKGGSGIVNSPDLYTY